MINQWNNDISYIVNTVNDQQQWLRMMGWYCWSVMDCKSYKSQNRPDFVTCAFRSEREEPWERLPLSTYSRPHNLYSSVQLNNDYLIQQLMTTSSDGYSLTDIAARLISTIDIAARKYSLLDYTGNEQSPGLRKTWERNHLWLVDFPLPAEHLP